MAQYDTWTKTKDDITVTISKKTDGTAGDRLVAFLKWLSEKVVDPDYGVSGDRPAHPIAPGGRPVDPGYGKPEGGAGRPDQGLPPSPGRPDNTLPGEGGKPPAGGGGRPDQGLPPGGLHPSHPIAGIGDKADEVAKIILGKCFDCKQPK